MRCKRPCLAGSVILGIPHVRTEPKYRVIKLPVTCDFGITNERWLACHDQERRIESQLYLCLELPLLNACQYTHYHKSTCVVTGTSAIQVSRIPILRTV